MSSYVDEKYTWQIKGRKLYLWKIGGYGSDIPDTQGRLKTSRSNVIYPDEDIVDGVRIEYTALISPFVDVDPNELDGANNPTLTEHTGTSITENSHLNFSRRLSLAIVDFLRAMISERLGQLDMREYYIRQFYKNVGDNDSNKRKIRFSFVQSPYGLR